MKEIARRQFCSLNYCNVDKMYFVLNDQNFIEKFYAENDKDAIAYFMSTDWETLIAEQKKEDNYPLLSDKDISEMNTERHYCKQMMGSLRRKLCGSLTDEQYELFDRLSDLNYRLTSIDAIMRQDKEFKRYLKKKGVR